MIDTSQCRNCEIFKDKSKNVLNECESVFDAASIMEQFTLNCISNGCKSGIYNFDRQYSIEAVIDILTSSELHAFQSREDALLFLKSINEKLPRRGD